MKDRANQIIAGCPFLAEGLSTPTSGGQASFFGAALEKRSWSWALLIILFVLFCLPVTNHAQTPGWQWATGPTGTSTVTALCADAFNHEYITGFYLGPVVFGADTVNNNFSPYQNIFVTKYDAQGHALWVKNAIGYADAQGIATDASGNVFVVGNFYNDSITFGSHTLTDATPGNSNVFLAKYDSLGNVLWAENLGGPTKDFAFGVCTDVTGNVFITGYFKGDSLTLGNIVLRAAGIDNVFVAKLSATGTLLWAHSEGTTQYDASSAICSDGYGNVFVTGYFSSPKMAFGTDTLSSAYIYNLFVTKYDAQGNVLWAHYAGSNYGDGSTGIASDAAGNVFVTGYYSDTLVVGFDTLAGVGYQNIFTAKYDSTGALLWALSEEGTNVDQANAITTDASGNAYVTGYLQSDTVLFGATELINGYGNQTTFVVKYDAFGNAGWVLSPGGTSTNSGAGIAYNNGSVYVTGNYQSGPIIFGNDTLTQQNIFLAKLDSSVSTGIAPVVQLTEGVTVYPNPSTGYFYFKGVGGGNTIEIYNVLGQCVYNTVADRDNYPVKLGVGAKGVYVYRVIDADGVYRVGKVLVE